MKNVGLLLIVLGVVAIVLAFVGVGGGDGVRSLPVVGVLMAAAGFVLYRRNRGKAVAGRS